ncbi:hypothetical protein HBH79_146890 [Parastagonospora nodorum]|nr:hypothetical protein HBH46_022680 [Parastagonospora nodorum]KAH4311217.1 hypothetical protein HBI01_020230 [Parastagonospora nodorum]KAH4317094.1 hypothetical protein HBI02_036570 [Parastagonospora nodorum]KAH4326701.1 hypothetical protein HBI00_140470 [Parastagonospora nodorum]KAH4388554.1 hypothetical protein HBH94_036430 [Parastagonospora nodorum]
MAGTKLILMSRPGLIAPFEPERLPISRLSNNPPPGPRHPLRPPRSLERRTATESLLPSHSVAARVPAPDAILQWHSISGGVESSHR